MFPKSFVPRIQSQNVRQSIRNSLRAAPMASVRVVNPFTSMVKRPRSFNWPLSMVQQMWQNVWRA